MMVKDVSFSRGLLDGKLDCLTSTVVDVVYEVGVDASSATTVDKVNGVGFYKNVKTYS